MVRELGIGPELSTSDVCHTLLKPATVPEGWRCIPTLTDAEKGWYSHEYEEVGTGVRQSTPPPGTMSYCQWLLLQGPETARFVGPPTCFLSHAWGRKFVNTVSGVESFCEGRGACRG